MSGAHIEMNAAMNGLSSYSIRLDWDSYIQRMHVPLRVRNVNSISKMLSLSLSLSLSLAHSLALQSEFRKCTNEPRTHPARFSIPENHSNVDEMFLPSAHPQSSVHSRVCRLRDLL